VFVPGTAIWFVRVAIGLVLTKLAFLALPTGASLGRGTSFTIDTITDPTGKDHGLLTGLARWDAVHYIHIARFGYPPSARGETTSSLAAFFPLYPMLVRFVSFFIPFGSTTDRYRLAAVLVSWGALLAAVWGIMLLVRMWTPGEDARDAALAFVWFPASVFLLAGYNEALFAALLAWALVSFAKERYVEVAIFAGLCSATRSQGALVAILIVWPLVTRKLPVVKGLLLCVVAEAGLLAYMVYCRAHFGSLLAFVHAEKFWNRKLTYPLHPVLWFVNGVLRGQDFPSSQAAVFALSSIAAVLAVAGCAALVVISRKGRIPIPLPAVVLACALVLLDISSGPFGRSPEAIARFVMTVIPLYLLVPIVVRKLPSGRSWIMASAMVAGLFQVIFTLGYWFT
jgi:hypothetical protein